MSSHPTTIIDVAHNTASIAALMKVLDEEFQFQTQVANRRRTLIFAASQDKDVRGMLQLLLAGCDRLILTRFCTNPRSVPPNELFQLVKEILASESPPEVLLADTPARAWEVARTGAGAEDVICITGSFFLAAEMRPIVRGDGTIRH